MYFAHSLKDMPDTSEWQTLLDHLTATAELSADFAKPFGAEQAGRIAGLFHDLGKYSRKFQARLRGGASVDHSTAGAVTLESLAASTPDKIMARLLAYAIVGHHAGLPDIKELNQRFETAIEPIDPVWQQELAVSVSGLWPKDFICSQSDRALAAFQIGFLGRMIFSALVDADYKDTERFYSAHNQQNVDRDWPGLSANIESLIARFDTYMAEKQRKASASALNVLRAEILTAVRAKAHEPAGLFTLTVPTGGGKTLASLAFALDHAKAHGLRRIIYAIPFTSIIDQTAVIFREVLGEAFVLEHHSLIEEERFSAREQRDKLRLAMEDWAAPCVVTTNVQLFESLFANRPSRCRKLHNLAHSVIVLDEAQTLPHGLLRPCMAALDELARSYGCTIVLCTATQPALDKRVFTQGGGLALEGRELAPDPARLARALRRVQMSRCGEMNDDQLVEELAQQEQALVIVNGRRHALELYKKARAAGLDGVVHLTTRQTAADRRPILARIRQDLADKKPCRLIATSLIEAGVDVDFPRVWRAEAGLDQMAQAAGRCNREGRRPLAESIVTIFKPKDHAPPREIAQLAADFARMADKNEDLLSPEAIEAYFREVFWRKGPHQLDKKEILAQFMIASGKPVVNYRQVAQDFKFIESGLTAIVIPGAPKVAETLAVLNNPDASPGKAARDLQSFLVQVPQPGAASLIKNARAKYWRPDLWGDQFLLLDDMKLYRPGLGLVWEDAEVLGDVIF